MPYVQLDGVQIQHGQLPRLPNKCYIVAHTLDEELNTEILGNLTKVLKAKPKLIINISRDDVDIGRMKTLVPCPWIVLTNVSKVSITCPGCGTTHRGIWKKNFSSRIKGVGSFSKNLQPPLCCNEIQGRTLRVTHTNFGKAFGTKDGKIDTSTHEGHFLNNFLKKYQIKPTFRNANFIWGKLDNKTKIWNGMIGNVSSIKFKKFISRSIISFNFK